MADTNTDNKNAVNSPQEALLKLKQGNEHYINSKTNNADISKQLREETATNGQKPYAVIMTCSDSRAPTEHIFSAGIGELFVVRTAGNVVKDIELGSIEFAVKYLGAKIIVVMGHSDCGAVAAAMRGHIEGHITNVVNEIQPGIKGAADIAEAENLNILNSYNKILESEIVRELVESNKIAIVRAKYDLPTGRVEFLSS